MPGRGQTSEFLGRCHLALGQPDKAETLFKQAVDRDPRLKPTVDLSMATLEQGRGRVSAARARMESAAAADAPTGRALRDLAGVQEPAPGVGLKFAASVTAGYNDNVIGLGNTMPLPADISSKGSAFVRASFGVSNTLQINPQTQGAVGYGLLIDRYNEFKTADLDDHYVFADIARRVNEPLAVSLRVSQQFTYLDGSHFRTQPSIRPAVAYRFTANSVTEAAYLFAAPDYARAAANPVFERDGEIHAFTVNHQVRMPDSPWSGSAGYSHTENHAQGADFRSAGDAISVSLRYAFPGKINLTAGANLAQERYKNANSLTGTLRRDRPESVSVQLSGPLTGKLSDKLRYYVQLQAGQSRSNIAFYDYEQRTLMGGITAGF